MRSLPSIVSLHAKKGADFHIVCKVRDPKTHAGVDITDSFIESDIMDTIGNGLFVASFVIIESAMDVGEFFLHLPNSVTNDIVVQAGVFDVFITFPVQNDEVPIRKLMFQGKITFDQEQTDGV